MGKPMSAVYDGKVLRPDDPARDAVVRLLRGIPESYSTVFEAVREIIPIHITRRDRKVWWCQWVNNHVSFYQL